MVYEEVVYEERHEEVMRRRTVSPKSAICMLQRGPGKFIVKSRTLKFSQAVV